MSKKKISTSGKTPFSFKEHSVDGLTVADLEELLENVQQSGDQFSARCPAHADSSNSLSFSEKNGKLLVHCHAGCDFGEVIKALKRRKAGEEQTTQVKYADSSHLPAADPPVIGDPGQDAPRPDDDDDDSDEGPGDEENGEADGDHDEDGEEESIHAFDWDRVSKQNEANFTEDQRNELANRLGVTAAALTAVRAGWDRTEKCYTFPEVDAEGNVIGIVRRFEDGQKKSAQGGHRGLSVPTDWKTLPGPVLIPEGPSDVAAGVSMGLCTVGRPSATGGLKHLVGMLKSVPADRQIVVVGEMDAKADGRWPGKEAAEKMAKDLSAESGRDVGWVLPPDGKDLRDYLQRRPEGMTPTNRGQAFLKHVAEKGKVEEPGDRRYNLDIIAAPELLKSDVRPVWAMKGILVAGQPAIIGGAKKALKTSIAIDLAISLATGTPFLNNEQFEVPKEHKVCLFSGESGAATIKDTIGRQLVAKNIRWKGKNEIVKNLYVGFKLPQFSVPESLSELEALLVREKFDVLIVDPLYLCLLSQNSQAQASNLFDMGPLLLNLTEVCLRHGTTPILLHHFTKNRNPSYKPPELDDFAFAGPAEFARQWILLGRREAFMPGSGTHKLWLNVGGSVGFSGCWAVDIDEGSLKDDFTGRTWGVEVRTQSEEIELQKGRKEQKERVKAGEADEKDKSNRRKIVQYLTVHDKGETLTNIRNHAGVAKDRVKELLAEMVDEGRLEVCKIRKPAGKNKTGNLVDAFRLIKEEAKDSDDKEEQTDDEEQTDENPDDESMDEDDEVEEPGDE